jgi:hypothetical protein
MKMPEESPFFQQGWRVNAMVPEKAPLKEAICRRSLEEPRCPA